jgi:cytochrome c oxidase subunit II
MKALRFAAALIAAAALTSCHGRQSILNSAGPLAHRIEWLWWFIFTFCAVAFVLQIGALTRAASRHFIPGGPAPKPMDPAKIKEENQRSAPWVAGAVAITVLSMFAILVASVITGKKVEGLNSKNPVTIQIIGHQWWWEVRYPNTQPSMTVTTANEIHVPTGMPVVLLLQSEDVIHSFWAPNIQGKRDLIPPYQNAFWIQVDDEGVYRGQCAEYCGHQHAHMAFDLIAESPTKFQAWQQAQVKPAAEPADPEAKRGEQIFLSGPCVMCHTIRGTPAGSHVGPDLTHLASRRTIGAGTLPNTPGNLAGWIMDSQRIKPGNRMPPISLSGDDLTALLTYLRTLN